MAFCKEFTHRFFSAIQWMPFFDGMQLVPCYAGWRERLQENYENRAKHKYNYAMAVGTNT